MDNNIPEHYYDQGSNTLCSGSSPMPTTFSTATSCNAQFNSPTNIATFPVQNMGTTVMSGITVTTAPKTDPYDNCIQLTPTSDPHNIFVRWKVNTAENTVSFMMSGLVAPNYQSSGEAGYLGIALYPYNDAVYPPYDGGHPDGVSGSTDNFTDLWVASASLFNGSRCYPFCIDDAWM
jgi:hypothetical protein